MKAQRRILLVDDDPLQYACVREMVATFRWEQFEVDWAPTYNEGLRQLLSGRHCACLLDYNLGSRNGLDLLREAMAKHCGTPVVMLTGMASGDVDFQALNAGALDYLDKTEVTPRNLERCLRYAIKLGEGMQTLRGLATHDALTGLLNRREFDRLINEEILRASRFRRGFGVILLDIDHFKLVNDTHGHQAGDAVLVHIARVLATVCRGTDRVARFGGEEFAILEPEADEAAAAESAERIRTALEELPCPLQGPADPIRTTLSAGVAAYPNNGDGCESLLREADRALYEAKSLGRNRVCRASQLRAPRQA